ncbi:toprim domain-containing protein [Idiomarina abyssalis]|uniref:toprim domain-containing protein n=1 Tax=Idiomarina abyssalis TaxID=86102 RepID=UPI001CD5670A|nr:toprim domain-containing protein [Idiomarina abyssalis]
MNLQLREEVVSRLLRDFDFKTNNREFFQQGRCPDCGKKELYAPAESPWVVRCGRMNKCAAEIHIKDLYPELFESWSDRYKPTPKSPTASADAYLRDGRSFDISKLKGWYTQGSYYCTERKIGTATVKFELPNGASWERFIDKPQRFGKMKANFVGKYKGQWWQPPTGIPEDAKEIWLTEGIFDAISLIQSGIPAVSLMSCYNYPTDALDALEKACKKQGRELPTLVFALDDGPAGESFTRKFVNYARKAGFPATAAQPPKGKVKLDWNELFQRDRLNRKNLDEYLYLGSLLIAKNATEKARLMHQKTQQKEFPFRFDNRLFWFKIDYDRYVKAMNRLGWDADDTKEASEEDIDNALKESSSVVELAACYPEALYYQAHEVTDESWYYFRVSFPHDNAPIKNTFSGGQLSSASEFKKRIMGVAPGAVFTGSSGQLDRLMKQQLYDIKRVQGIDFVGYSKEHGIYILGDVAIKDGRAKPMNDEDFFEFGKTNIKTLNKSIPFNINTDLKEHNSEWENHLYTGFKETGLISLAFWFGSFFAEQIRATDKSFPFLELIGEPGSGKSTLIEFMWMLCGRAAEEGFDPVKSTAAARARKLSQVANLPTVLIEADRGDEKDAKQKGFDWDELKTAYNGRSNRSRGVKNAGNETYDPPFRSSIVISQNAEVQASQAILERIIQIKTSRKGHTSETQEAAMALENMPIEEVSGWVFKCVLAEKQVLELYYEKFPHYKKELEANDSVKTARIIKNHAQIMALLDCLQLVTGYKNSQIEAAKEMVVELAGQRQQAISADHTLVQQFWDVYDYLEDKFDHPIVNHSSDDSLIAVNLNHMEEEASEHRQKLPLLADLKKHLKACKSRKFVGIKTVRSAVNDRFNKTSGPGGTKKPASVKCWVFRREM